MEQVETIQDWKGKKISFDPDSSPAAWKHYQSCYPKVLAQYGLEYDLEHPRFFLYQGGTYQDASGKDANRLYACEGAYTADNVKFMLHLGGDTVFNFNEKKCRLFQQLIAADRTADAKRKSICLKELEKVRKAHHAIENFSLIQAVGNLQGVKGENRFDRPDVFFRKLARYYQGLAEDVLSEASKANRSHLIGFLNKFPTVYEYVHAMYLINDRALVDEMIAQGALPVSNCAELERYMHLACCFWRVKAERLKSGY